MELISEQSASRGEREGVEMLEAVLGALTEGVIVSTRDRYLYVNDAAAAACGYASGREMIAAGPVETLARFEMQDEHGRRIAPEDLPAFRIFASEPCPPEVLVQWRARGASESRWSVLRAAPIPARDGSVRATITFFSDCTEKRRAEEALRRSVARDRFLTEAASVLASSLDYEATLKAISKLAVPRFADWASVYLVEGDGVPRPLAIENADPEKLRQVLEMMRRCPPRLDGAFGPARVLRTGEAELVGVSEVNRLIDVAVDEDQARFLEEAGFRSCVSVPLVARGRTLGVLSFFRGGSSPDFEENDLAMAKELGHFGGLAIDNSRLYAESQEAIHAREEFLSIASHELRDPLTTLYLQLQLVERSLEEQPCRAGHCEITQRMESITRQAKRLGNMVDLLLDFTRLNAGKLFLDPAPFDLAEIVRELVSRASEEARRAGSTISFESESALIGVWDRLRVEQAVGNLVANALKYGLGQPVQVRVDAQDGFARVHVADSGEGIAPELHERIFERFERGARKNQVKGLGLGLYVTRQIAEAHGGRVRVESAPGAGAVFTLELPLSPPPPVSAGHA